METKFSDKAVDQVGSNEVELCSEFNYIKGFILANINRSTPYEDYSQESETALIILQGVCDITINENQYKDIGERKNVFDGLPFGAYIPVDTHYSIQSEQALVAVCKCKCEKKTREQIISPKQIKVMEVGKDNWTREVRIILGPDSPAVNLILGETINPPGNWSGIPPAKHEQVNLPYESLHEELYYFKTDKPQGWGVERIYSPERKCNQLVHLEDGTVTFMPWGYHQVVAAPGYTLYYLFFLGGEGNNLAQFEDPEHNWIK